MLDYRFIASDLRIEGERPTIIGHAAVFNRKSLELGGYREIVRPGTFAKTIKSTEVCALYNHDMNILLGRTRNSTLQLSEDEIGLAVRISPPDTTKARDVLNEIRDGYVDQMSFGFRPIGVRWITENDERIRELIEVELFDVSPVVSAAYPQTDVHVRHFFPAESERAAFYEAEMAKFYAVETKTSDQIKAECALRAQRINGIF